MNIEGKVILITGGASGIGFAIVKEFLLNNAKGIAIVDCSEDSSRKAKKEVEAFFGSDRAIFIKADVSNKKELEDAFETTVQFYKQLDIVINNAGISNEATWEKVVEINLMAAIRGSYLAMEKYLPKYKSGDEGVIVNIGSLMALTPSQISPIYSATKAGIINLGGGLGGDEFYKKYRVKVLTMCPGLVKTDLLNDYSESKVFFPHKIKEELNRFRSKAQPAKCVAAALLDVLKIGGNGSIWVAENEEKPYEVVIPDRSKMRK